MLLALLLSPLAAWSAHAALDQAYFDRLHREKVISSERVEWTQIGPGMAGYCEAFWCHPTDADVMFMSPDMYNSYGTWDGGRTWQTIKDCDGDGRDMRRVQSITFSHQNPDFGFATDIRGILYRTADRGHRWTPVTSFDGQGVHSELAVDPSDDRNWYIGAGDFWNVKANHRSMDRSKPYVYRYAAYGHIYKSTDQGKSWKKINRGLPPGLDVGRIIVDPTDSKTLIMAAESGLYRSTDQGESWTPSGAGLPVNWPRDLTSFHDRKTGRFILYVVLQTTFAPAGRTVRSEGGVFKSLDHGATWSDISGNLAVDLRAIHSNFARNKFRSALAGWFSLESKAVAAKFSELPAAVFSVFNRIAINPLNADEIFVTQNVKHDAGFVPGDVWKTSDGGKTWRATARTGTYWQSNPDASYWASRDSPTAVNTHFAHLQPEMDRHEETSGNRFLRINPRGEVFICLDQQVMRSSNGGTSWEQIDDMETPPGSGRWVGRGGSNLPGRFMLLETGRKDRYLLCSGEHGLWQIDDPGAALAERSPIAVRQLEGQRNEKGAHSIATVAVHPQNPDMIYMLVFRQSHRGQFRRSTDNGRTWHNVSKPIALEGNESNQHVFQSSLIIDPKTPDNIYFCVIRNPISEVGGSAKLPASFHDYGIKQSRDGGKTWSTANQGLPADASVNRLAMDPADPSVLYAALNESRGGQRGGLFKSLDQAGHWSRVDVPAEITAVNHVFVDRHTGHIFISCGTRNGPGEAGGVWRSPDHGVSWEKIFDLPYIWQTETSPLNPKLITVVAAAQDGRDVRPALNCGAYLSRDGGNTWEKINRNLGQPDRITDLKPDPYRADVLWCALWGSGWTVGYMK